MRLDSGGELQEVLLAEGVAGWRNATKRHEDEAAQFGGVVANPDSRKSRGELLSICPFPPARTLKRYVDEAAKVGMSWQTQSPGRVGICTHQLPYSILWSCGQNRLYQSRWKKGCKHLAHEADKGSRLALSQSNKASRPFSPSGRPLLLIPVLIADRICHVTCAGTIAPRRPHPRRQPDGA